MMRAMILSMVAVVLLVSVHASASAYQPPAGQGDYLPVTSSQPAVESLPAAPLLITAYAFVWVALVGYLWFLWSRLKNVQSELEALRRRTGGREGGQ
jgi:CcmD family protein